MMSGDTAQYIIINYNIHVEKRCHCYTFWKGYFSEFKRRPINPYSTDLVYKPLVYHST